MISGFAGRGRWAHEVDRRDNGCVGGVRENGQDGVGRDGGSDRVLVVAASRDIEVVEIEMQENDSDVEKSLLIALSAQLGFSSVGAGVWAAFNDRLWDLLTAEDHPPVAVLVKHFDRVLREDVHVFVRCIHKLLSMTESVGLSATEADLQVEYFFAGRW